MHLLDERNTWPLKGEKKNGKFNGERVLDDRRCSERPMRVWNWSLRPILEIQEIRVGFGDR